MTSQALPKGSEQSHKAVRPVRRGYIELRLNLGVEAEQERLLHPDGRAKEETMPAIGVHRRRESRPRLIPWALKLDVGGTRALQWVNKQTFTTI